LDGGRPLPHFVHKGSGDSLFFFKAAGTFAVDFVRLQAKVSLTFNARASPIRGDTGSGSPG